MEIYEIFYGRTTQKRRSGKIMKLNIMQKFLTLLLGTFITFSSPTLALDPKDAKPEDIKKNDAQYRCEGFASETFDAQQKVKFEFFEYFPVNIEKDGSYTILVGFNDTTGKHTKECKIKEEAPDDWQLISLKDIATTPEIKNAK